MAHFAKLNSNSVVVFVTVGRDEDNEQELTNRTGDVYKQTSYNTSMGVYRDPITNEPADDQSKAFRKNFAGIGYTYDSERDAFIPPKTYSSWVLNESTCCWEPPIVVPNDENEYSWNEETQSWDAISGE